jgi:hypothetical protein
VTVHVVAAPDVTPVGAHASEETFGLGATETVAVALLAPSVAVKVEVCGVVIAPDVAANVVDVAPAGTVAEGGVGSAAVLLEASVTRLPPVGAP